jgi:hypothetical protein
MATYIQGVTDYIPDFQPFQPDYNFYNNVLQAKQNQYDKNYKQLNNLYGQLYYQDVTRDSSNKMKDDYLKNIDYELKRVSGLDLSLEQNVEQAKQIFRPIYENKNLMKDMALTKNYTDEKSRALALATSKNKEDRGAYWDVGIKDMDYRLEEFKNADESEVLNFGNIMYTPNVNATKQYLDMAKEYNLSVDITEPDASGMYTVRQKNGDLIIPTLQKMFYADYINDPALQKKYSTEAYVKRKDEAKARASKYGNNEVLAEKEFLKEQFLFLKDYTKEKTKQAEEAVAVSTNKKNNVEQDISNGKVNPFQPAYLQKIAQAIEVDDIVYKHNRDLSEEIDPSGNGTIQGNDITSVEGLNLDNLEQARSNVDRLLASYLAEQDIIFAADAYSKNDMIYKKEISPLGLETVRHQNAMQRDQINNERADRRATAKINAASEDARIKYLLENDLADIDPDTGQIARDPYTGEIIIKSASPQQEDKSKSGKGGQTDSRTVNMVKHNREVLMENIDNLSSGYVETWVNSIKNGVALGEIKANDLAYLFGTDRAGGQKIWNEIQNNFDNGADGRQKLVRDLTINAKIFDYKKRMDAWALKNNATSVGEDYNTHSSISSYKLDQMRMFYKVHRDTKEENRKRIANTLSTKLENTGIKDKALRYTIIDQYLKKYVTGETWEDDEFNDVLENIFDSYEKRTGKKASPPGFFERAGKTIKALPTIVGLNPGNPAGTLEAISNAFSSSDLLSEMNNEYENIVYQPDHKLGLISYLPDTKGTAGSKASKGAIPTFIDVNLGRKDDNLISFNQFLYDLTKINFNQADKNSYRVSLDGNEYDPDAEIDVNLNNKLYNMLFDLKNLSKNKDQRSNPTIFKLAQSQIAAENSDLGAMEISNIPNEVIKKYFDEKTDAEVIDKIKTNGITYIAPTSNWKNSLFQSNRITPTEAILNTGKKLSYVDPTYGHTVIFDKDNVTGNYRYTTVIRAVDDNGEYFEMKGSSMAQPFGKQIDGKLNEVMKAFADANARLKEDYERFHNSNNEKVVKAFNEKFGRAPKNPGFNTL